VKWFKQLLDATEAERAYLKMMAHRDQLLKENIELLAEVRQLRSAGYSCPRCDSEASDEGKQ
jgi:hypothetical protein